jgi:hypothetical protein
MPLADSLSSASLDPSVQLAVYLLEVGYFLPTLIALLRRRRTVWPTFWINLLTGWTGIGWLAALVTAFGDRRPVTVVQQVVIPQQPMLPASWAPWVVVSPDGGHWWDGREWLDATEWVPWGALKSPDGQFWWDGYAWRGGGPRGRHRHCCSLVGAPGPGPMTTARHDGATSAAVGFSALRERQGNPGCTLGPDPKDGCQ